MAVPSKFFLEIMLSSRVSYVALIDGVESVYVVLCRCLEGALDRGRMNPQEIIDSICRGNIHRVTRRKTKAENHKTGCRMEFSGAVQLRLGCIHWKLE